MLAGVYAKDCGAAFSPELIAEVAEAVMGSSLTFSLASSPASTPANSRSCSPCPRTSTEEAAGAEEVQVDSRRAAAPYPQLLTVPRPAHTGKLLALPEKRIRGASPENSLSPAVGKDLSVPSKHKSSGKLLVQVLRVLCERCGVSFQEAIGQVLFRNRRADVIRKRKDWRHSSEDLSWIAAAAEPADQAALGGVEDVFRAMCIAGELRTRQWQRVVQLIIKNPVLAGRVRLSDTDRLFYEITHRDVEATYALTSVHKFKELLALLSEAAGVHPAVVFIAVGSHGQQLAKTALSACE